MVAKIITHHRINESDHVKDHVAMIVALGAETRVMNTCNVYLFKNLPGCLHQFRHEWFEVENPDAFDQAEAGLVPT